MTNDKQKILTQLKTEFNAWEALLAGLTEEQIVSVQQPSGLTVKDQMAHLWAWQQLSIARLEAALHHREPQLPDWPKDLDFDSEEEEPTNAVNAWFHENSRATPWPDVYRDWKTGFVRFLELAEAIPESEWFDEHRFAWLDGYPLSIVMIGSYEHHHIDHLEPLRDWLREQKLTKD